MEHGSQPCHLYSIYIFFMHRLLWVILVLFNVCIFCNLLIIWNVIGNNNLMFYVFVLQKTPQGGGGDVVLCPQ